MQRKYSVTVEITEREAFDLAKEYDKRGLSVDLGGYVMGPFESVIKKLHEAIQTKRREADEQQ